MRNDEICISTFLTGEWEDDIVKKQFEGKSLFKTEKLSFPSLSRWSLFRCAVELSETRGDDDVIVICFNNHCFTDSFDERLFLNTVVEASQRGGQLLLGGCQTMGNLVPVSQSLFWLDITSGASFYVVYRSAYEKILSIRVDDDDLDKIITQYVPNKFLICPVVSQSSEQDLAKGVLDCYQRVIKKYHLL